MLLMNGCIPIAVSIGVKFSGCIPISGVHVGCIPVCGARLSDRGGVEPIGQADVIRVRMHSHCGVHRIVLDAFP